MREAYGAQQGDAWIRNRVGRITASRMADVCSFLTRKSGDKNPGDSSAEREKYKMELIAERITGRAADKYVSPYMEWGTDTEEDARLCYEGLTRVMVEPVNFVLHPLYDFTGASPDALVGADGLLEIKAPQTTTHLRYIIGDVVPDDYLPQIGWELACTGRQWADFLSYDPRVMDEAGRFFCRRVTVDELTWTTWDKTEYKGATVLEYFTAQVLQLEAEINQFIEGRKWRAVAPFPVEFKAPKAKPVDDPDDPYAFLDDNLAGVP